MILVGTISGDMPFPATSCLVQRNIGATRAAASDVGRGLRRIPLRPPPRRRPHPVRQGRERARHRRRDPDALSSTGRTATPACSSATAPARSCSRATKADHGILGSLMKSNGNYHDFICMPGGGSDRPANDPKSIEERLPFIKMKGNETFKVAVKAMADVSLELLTEQGFTHEQIDLFIPHQANLRIIDAVGERLKIDPREGLQERGPLRQHVGRLHPDRARGVRPRGPPEGRRPRSADRLRRRPRLGQRARCAGSRDARAAVPRAGLAIRSGWARRSARPRRRRGRFSRRRIAVLGFSLSTPLLRRAGGRAAADGEHAARDPDALDRGARRICARVSRRSSRAPSSPPATRSASTRRASRREPSPSPTRCALVRARGDVHAGGRAARSRSDGRDRRASRRTPSKRPAGRPRRARSWRRPTTTRRSRP